MFRPIWDGINPQIIFSTHILYLTVQCKGAITRLRYVSKYLAVANKKKGCTKKCSLFFIIKNLVVIPNPEQA